MYIVVEIDGFMVSPINDRGKPDLYSKPKLFKTMKSAEEWILKHQYVGMSVRYEVRAISKVEIGYWERR